MEYWIEIGLKEQFLKTIAAVVATLHIYVTMNLSTGIFYNFTKFEWKPFLQLLSMTTSTFKICLISEDCRVLILVAPQPAIACSKLSVDSVFLVSLLLTLNIFHTLF